MEPLGNVFDKFKCFAKSSQDFVAGVFRRREDSSLRNPIEILKRLQREAFSDLMKLRDRQDKVERMLSFYKPSKGGPFQEATTHVKGQVDLLGALLTMDDINQQNLDAISRGGMRTGVDSRLIFETNIRQKDTLVAEFVASQKGKEHHGDILGSPLSLAKLCYMAKVCDWLSVMAIPMGAQCKDFGIASNSFHLGKGLTDVSSVGPPLLNVHTGSAIGIMVGKSNILASLAQFVSGLGMQSGSNTMENCSSTFGEIACQFPRGVKLSLLGLYQVPLSSNELTKLGALTIPILSSKSSAASETVSEALPLLGTKTQTSTGSIALMLESELDEITKIGGWVEMNKLTPKSVQWGLSMSDVSEDSFGWGMNLNGMIGDLASGDLFQAESYLKFNLGLTSRSLKGIVGEERAKFILGNSIFLVVAGSDDIANTYFVTRVRQLQYDIPAYTDLMLNSASNFLKEIYELGARRIGVFNAPPIGCVPSQRTLGGGIERECAEKYNEAATLFNSKLSKELDSLSTHLPDSRLVYIDVYNPFLDLILNYKKYGFKVVDRGCCGTGKLEVSVLCNSLDPTCDHVSDYVFWDSYHPTEGAYRKLIGPILKKCIKQFV